MWVVSFTPWPLCLEEKSFWCLHKVGRAPESGSTLVKKDKGLFPLQAIEFRTMQPVAYIMGAQIFQKSSSHLRILVARKVTWS